MSMLRPGLCMSATYVGLSIVWAIRERVGGVLCLLELVPEHYMQ